MVEMEIITAIANYGFPIAAYLLIYFDMRKLIEKNTDALEKVLIRFESLAKKLNC